MNTSRAPKRPRPPRLTRGLWKLPELWTRKRTRAHKLLGRRPTDAGAHSFHKAAPPEFTYGERT
jgi:hypothetical protein